MTRPLFIQAKNRGFFYLTLLNCLLALTWIIVGIYLQLVGSAAACPDWPQCFGFFTAPHTPSQIQLAMQHFPYTPIHIDRIWQEVIYRYLSASVLTGIILLTLAATQLWDELTIRPCAICLCLLLLSAAEIALRLHGVIQNQQPLYQFTHTVIAFSIISLLWWLSRITHPDTIEIYYKSHHHLRPWAWLSLLLTIQLVVSLSLNISYLNMASGHLAFCADTLTTCLHLNRLNLNHPLLLNILLSQRTLDLLARFSLGYLCLFSLLLLSDRQINHIAFFMLLLVSAKMLLDTFGAEGAGFTLPLLYQTSITAFLLMTLISLLMHVYRKPRHYW